MDSGLCYTRDLKDWHEFIRRSPDEYEKWIDETSKECEKLELQILDGLAKGGELVSIRRRKNENKRCGF